MALILDSYEGDLFLRRNAEALASIFASHEHIVGASLIDSLFGEVEVSREAFEEFQRSMAAQSAPVWQHRDGLVTFG